MGAAYSKDLRERVLNYIGKGHTRQRAADLFQVALNSIYRWQRLRKGGQSLAAKVRASTPRKLDYEKLAAYVRANADATLVEYAREFQVSATAIFNAFKKLGITRKKKQKLYQERDEEKRRLFAQELARIAKEDLVYLDESGLDNRLYQEYGRSPRGEKLFAEVAGSRRQRVSLIAAACQGRILAPLMFEGSCNTQVFNTSSGRGAAAGTGPGQGYYSGQRFLS